MLALEPLVAVLNSTMSESIRQLLPPFLQDAKFLSLAYWQWAALLLAIFLAVLADHASRILLRSVVRRAARGFAKELADAEVRYTVRPLGIAVGALTFLLCLTLLALPKPAADILLVATRVVLVVGLAWAGWALTDLVASVLMEFAMGTETTFDEMVIPLARKSLKLFILAMGTLYLADTFNIALAPLLGGLGLAGLAVSFAAQDIVKNLFGGVAIFLDRPFKIGERIKFGGYDGVIEEIGFRTTRLRTLTGHLVTIPNGSITSEPVENIGRRPSIRRVLTVTITYDTPRDKIEQAVEIIRSILREDGLREPIHKTINGSLMEPRVYFSDYSATSLDILVIYWYAPALYWDYLDHAQRFNLRLFEQFAQAGIEFAFPTQTVYLAGDPKRALAVDLPGAERPA